MAIIYAILVLGGIGATGAIALNLIAKRFHVEEDPRIALVEALLPGANCGACGQKGCHDFAVQCIKAGNLDKFYCPSAGQRGMSRIADVMGCKAEAVTPMTAYIKCGGTPETKTRIDAKYVGPRSCAIMNMTAGEYLCANSCLGCGDCTSVCKWGAITIAQGDEHPTIDTTRCTGCGVCVTNCPRFVIGLRPKRPIGANVYVACNNCMKGAITRKQCKTGCIACGLCVRACENGAIKIAENHAEIDYSKCTSCGKCASVCPMHVIQVV